MFNHKKKISVLKSLLFLKQQRKDGFHLERNEAKKLAGNSMSRIALRCNQDPNIAFTIKNY